MKKKNNDEELLGYYKKLTNSLEEENSLLKRDNAELLDVIYDLLQFVPSNVKCSWDNYLMHKQSERSSDVYDSGRLSY